jgi:hypothetical protein
VDAMDNEGSRSRRVGRRRAHLFLLRLPSRLLLSHGPPPPPPREKEEEEQRDEDGEE